MWLPRERSLVWSDLTVATPTLACRTAFDVLKDDERTKVLNEPMNEIVRMLEQNLLTKFQARASQEYGAYSSHASSVP